MVQTAIPNIYSKVNPAPSKREFYLLLFDKMTITIKFFTLMRMVKLKISVQRFANSLWGSFMGWNYSGNT